MFSGCTLTNTEDSSHSRIVLNQNSPNPFTDRTVVSYFIPQDIKQAQLLIYDGMGILIKKVDIKTKGSGSITLYGSNLRKGLYSYGIIADGKLIDTKKMIR